MKCADCRARLSALPDISPEALPAQVREHLQGCRACRIGLSALRLVEGGKGLRVESPAGLPESILERLAFARPRRSRKRLIPRWAPLAAAAAVAIVVATLALSHFVGVQRVSQGEVVRIHLTLDAPAAREVSVVGDWNGWNPTAQPLAERNGRWEIVLELPRGHSYQYQFLIDGNRWIPDPSSLVKVANGFGGVNSILGS